MTAKKTVELDFEIPGREKKSKFMSKKFNKIFLIASAGVLVVALAVAAVLLLGNNQQAARIIDFGTALDGVTVGGVDISGMTRDEALEATASLEGALLDTVKVSLDVNGELHEFGAAEMSITTDYISIINQAMDYGHVGTFDERKAAADAAKTEGKAYEISLSADQAALSAALANLKSTLDTLPRDASFQFMPWGYTLNEDGTAAPYTPDIAQMISDSSKHKTLTYPDNLVRLKPEEMPPLIRYQFYNNKKYKEDYVPEGAATIARFHYISEQTGLIADTAAVLDDIMAQVESESFSTITVPVQVTEPTVKLDQIKQQTHLITSWTSSYSTHDGSSRVWNVAKMSGIICGQILEPGVQWSINDTAGPRYTSNGWKKASGIVDGGYVDQPGGGVCQISSTLYNAAIRCGLTSDNIVSRHHSIISGYIPLGLDATISTGGPDLKFTNPYSTPLYIVSYMNPETKSVAVEIYGAPVIDPATGEEVIYNFDSKSIGGYGSAPIDIYYFDKTQLPDGTPIPAGQSLRYASQQKGRKIQTYRHYYKLDGTKYKDEDFEYVIIKPINGSLYCNYPDPATVTPTPPPTDPPTTSPPATDPPTTDPPAEG